MVAKQKTKKRPRPVYSKPQPLSVGASVTIFETYLPNTQYFWKTVASVVRKVPSYRNTPAGRQGAQFFRALLFAAAFCALAIQIELWPLSVILAGASLPLPIRHSKKTLWLSICETRSGPRERATSRHAEVHYDGRKVSLRVLDKVIRSVRPNEEPCTILIVRNRETEHLILSPKKDTKKRALSFVGPSGSLAPYILEQGALPESLPEFEIRVGETELTGLAECFAQLTPIPRNKAI